MASVVLDSTQVRRIMEDLREHVSDMLEANVVSPVLGEEIWDQVDEQLSGVEHELANIVVEINADEP
jgi:hypothetical protein